MGIVRKIGFNDRSKPTHQNGKMKKEYELWTSMLKRCLDSKENIKDESYVNCKISKNFKNYSYFHEWCQSQVGFNDDDFQLDKDLLIKGNKIYSEDTCVFVPRKLNQLLVKARKRRGNQPIGVAYNKNYGKFQAQISIDGTSNLIGYFDDETDAFNAYKEKKEVLIKSLAEEYKSRIDERVYYSLINYIVEITD